MADAKPSALARILARNAGACRAHRGRPRQDIAGRSRLRAGLLERIEAGRESEVRLGSTWRTRWKWVMVIAGDRERRQHLAHALEVDIRRLLREYAAGLMRRIQLTTGDRAVG